VTSTGCWGFSASIHARDVDVHAAKNRVK